jgi:hypothetical protein
MTPDLSLLRLVPHCELDDAEYEEFNHFCVEAATSSDPAGKNMPGLPLLIPTRFNGVKGQLYVILDGPHIVGCSGCYVSDFSPHVGLMGTRSWLLPSYRSQQIIRDLVLPTQRDWMKAQGMKQIALSFNDYNRNLIQFFKRQIVKRVPRSPRHMFYHNMIELQYRVMIQFTPQWVIFEALDPAWSFDWATLAYREPDIVN